MKNNLRPIGWFALMLISMPLAADIDHGLYLGAGIHEAEVRVDQIDETATSGHATLGFRFNRFMATELGLYNLGDYKQTAVVGNVIGEAEFSGWSTGIALVPRLPIWIFDVYGRFGVQYYDIKSQVVTNMGGEKDKETAANVYGSLGGAVNIGRHWSVYLEFSRFYTSERVDTAGLGFRYHFE